MQLYNPCKIYEVPCAHSENYTVCTALLMHELNKQILNGINVRRILIWGANSDDNLCGARLQSIRLKQAGYNQNKMLSLKFLKLIFFVLLDYTFSQRPHTTYFEIFNFWGVLTVFLGIFRRFLESTFFNMIDRTSAVPNVPSCQFLASWILQNRLIGTKSTQNRIIMTSSRDCDVISRDQSFFKYFIAHPKRLSNQQYKS